MPGLNVQCLIQNANRRALSLYKSRAFKAALCQFKQIHTIDGCF